MKKKLTLLLPILPLLLLISWRAGQDSSRTGTATVIQAADYPDLQAAFNALPEAGGTLQIPPGDFILNQPLVLTRKNTRVQGSGPSTRLINKNTSGQPALIVRHADRTEDKKQRLWRIEMSGFRISGNPESGDGLLMEGINELYLHGLTIERNGGNGISLIDCYENPRIIGLNVTYNGGAGLHILGGHDIVVSSNEFEENTHAVRCLDSYNLCMVGNNLDDHLSDGIIIENTYGSVVASNMIEECAGRAIVLDRNCYGVNLASNVIAHNQAGIDLRDAWGCAISANTFTIIPEYSLRVGAGSGRITVSGNNFSNSYIGGRTLRSEDAQVEWPQQATAAGVLLESTSDISLTGNTFAGLSGPAIEASGACRRIAVVGNVVVDTGRQTRSPKPFRFAEPASVRLEANVTD